MNQYEQLRTCMELLASPDFLRTEGEGRKSTNPASALQDLLRVEKNNTKGKMQKLYIITRKERWCLAVKKSWHLLVQVKEKKLKR